jgi:ParB family chromosome partitioning protein
LPVIPAIVRVTDEVGSMEQALIENLHREDLNPLEEAAAYQQLIEDFGLTHEELASRVARSRAAVSNTLRLFQLPPLVQKAVMEGQLSAGHARALLGTPDRSFQEALARRAVDEGLSVRAVEDAVKTRNELGGRLPTAEAGHSRLRPPGILELENLLSQHLDTRVKVDMGSRKGRVLIEFGSLEDLERIYRVMTEPEP